MADNIENIKRNLTKLNKMYLMLAEINQKIAYNKDIKRLLNDISKDIVEIGGYKSCILLEIQKQDDKLFLNLISFFGIETIDNLNFNELATTHKNSF
jgi:hypothetical protein